MVNMPNAINAPTRLTIDSSASDSKTTELVKKYATVFKLIVRIATAMVRLAIRDWSSSNGAGMHPGWSCCRWRDRPAGFRAGFYP